MFNLNRQKRFIYDELMALAWAGSVQRACLYNPGIPCNEKDRNNFKKQIFSFIETSLLPKYLTKCCEADHVENIQSLVEYGTNKGDKLLCKYGYKFGIAQKLLNLQLKYIWCLGYIDEPPHCPVDRSILSKTEIREKLNWTDIISIDKYNIAINAIRMEAKKAGLSISQWELRNW